MKRILIIEDDPAILLGLEASLKEEHFEILSSSDGEKGYQLGKKENLDLIILDVMLPNKNGFDICKDWRKEGNNTPVIMLTSKKDEIDKIMGLEIGADDYITKPFSVRELLARIKAVLRRKNEIIKDIEEYSFSNVHINFRKLEAMKEEKPLDLSATEFKVLKFFIEHEGEVVTREMLLDNVWGYESLPTTRTVDNFILSIRKQIEDDPSNPKHLITIHKAGYKFIK